MDSDLKELVEKYSQQVKIATPNDKVYKDECVYSFDNPESDTGLFVCLQTFVGVSRDYLQTHHAKTKSHLYLRLKTHRRELVKNQDDASDEPEKKKPTKFGIGIAGGFDLNEKEFYFDNDYALFIYPEERQIQLDKANLSTLDLNDRVRKSIESIINNESIYQKEELAAQALSWDGEKRFVSKHSANLHQVANPAQISSNPDSWKCDVCGLKTNLWLNLSDGKIMCGRRQLDGSGGNNHAIEHYQQTKNPLAVKLGTITGNNADVYSYDEDDMVEDSNLAVHLAHFGINMSKMEKTDKTMAELEIDLNQKVGEWDRIQESGSNLVPVYGSGYTGMRNLGNSCYMNSVVQALFMVPDFVEKYFKNRDAYVRNASTDPSNDLNFQLSKLAHGLLSGKYSKETPATDATLRPPKGIKPNSFKMLVGRGHAEFSTKRQQDAHEYLTYLFALIEKSLRTDTTTQSNPIDAFRFELEDRFECSQSGQVRYKKRSELSLPVPISRDLATNKPQLAEYAKRKADVESKGQKLEPGDIVRPEIRLEDCLRLFAQDEIITDFYSSAVKSKVNAKKSTLLSSFPDYLLMQARKFELAPDWTPVKLDVSLQVPDQLDLSQFRSKGRRDGEVELKDDEPEQAGAAQVQLNEGIIGQLMDMGFSLEASKRSAYNTRDQNSAEAAVEWAMMHMADDDFNAPFELPSTKKNAPKSKVYNEEAINSIISFGFTRAQAIKALEATDNNLERAADWVFTHPDELMDVDESAAGATSREAATATATAATKYRDGNGKYSLVGFISHMGTNANVGHYVVHLLKNGKWTIFNDENVALSEHPPKDLAYLYLYKRTDS